MSDYPQLSNINSQIVEQSNSALQRMLSYMNVTNFMNHCKFYVQYQNYKNNCYYIRTCQVCSIFSHGCTAVILAFCSP